jgi:hypothetical protein
VSHQLITPGGEGKGPGGAWLPCGGGGRMRAGTASPSQPAVATGSIQGGRKVPRGFG